jgi:hypothetical protein
VKLQQGRKTTYSGLHPSIQERKDMIENDADMTTGFNRMFENATNKVRDLRLSPLTHD